MEHELKGIRYQSEKYAKLTTLINRVNEESLKEPHLTTDMWNWKSMLV